MSSFLLNTIQQISEASVEAMKPADIFFGVVESVDPLIIGIDQKLKLTRDVLLLTSNVSDCRRKILTETNKKNAVISGFDEINGNCFIEFLPDDEYVTVKCGLLEGENVILLRAFGGQKFVVLDRVVSL